MAFVWIDEWVSIVTMILTRVNFANFHSRVVVGG
jgi:hypothetical protein